MVFAYKGFFLYCLPVLGVALAWVRKLVVEDELGWAIFWWCRFSHLPTVGYILLIMAGIENENEIKAPGKGRRYFINIICVTA